MLSCACISIYDSTYDGPRCWPLFLDPLFCTDRVLVTWQRVVTSCSLSSKPVRVIILPILQMKKLRLTGVKWLEPWNDKLSVSTPLYNPKEHMLFFFCVHCLLLKLRKLCTFFTSWLLQFSVSFQGRAFSQTLGYRLKSRTSRHLLVKQEGRGQGTTFKRMT